MSAPEVTWLGSQKLNDILNHPMGTTRTKMAALGLVLLHGTWNVGRRRNNSSSTTPTTDAVYPKEKALLTTWIQQALLVAKGGAASSCEYYAATVEIDPEDDATCSLLIEGRGGRGDAENQHQLQLPIPPAELPALALVLHNQSDHVAVTLRYVSETALYLLDVLNGGVKPTSMYTKAISDAVQTVVEDLFYDYQKMQQQVDDATFSGEEGGSAVEDDHVDDTDEDALRIFVAGDRSSVGKSSVCLGILGSLLNMGYPATTLAYIKPATQSESTQLIQLYCEKHGIKCVPIGPLVYYRGFTRAFLAGETESTKTLLKGCQQAVDQVARGRRVVLVDGVGFPAVGSICGTDNVAVLCACSYPRRRAATTAAADDDSDDVLVKNRKPMGVVLVGGSGVGAAVDGFNLNACYFEQRQVPVLGAIFNKLSETGFYSLENCKSEISKYFDQQQQQQQQDHDDGNFQQPKRGRPFGFLPLFPAISGDKAMDHVEEFLTMFSSRVDVAAILDAARQVQERDHTSTTSSGNKTLAATPENKTSSIDTSPTKRRKLMATVAATSASNSASAKRTRQEIEVLAIAGGAAPSA